MDLYKKLVTIREMGKTAILDLEPGYLLRCKASNRTFSDVALEPGTYEFSAERHPFAVRGESLLPMEFWAVEWSQAIYDATSAKHVAQFVVQSWPTIESQLTGAMTREEMVDVTCKILIEGLERQKPPPGSAADRAEFKRRVGPSARWVLPHCIVRFIEKQHVSAN